MHHKQFTANHVRDWQGVQHRVGHREELVVLVFAGAFVVEAVDAVDWLAFVVAAGDEEAFRAGRFERAKGQ